MSHSYKHTPICKDNTRGRKSSKLIANSKVRCCRDEDIPTHKRAWFKRVFEQWDIYDYIGYVPKANMIKQLTQDWLKEEEEQISKKLPVSAGYYHKSYHTLNNFINHFIQNYWHKFYKRK